MSNWLSRAYLGDGNPNDPKTRTRVGQRVSLTCILCNVLLCAAKAAVGLACGMVSIVADAVNNLSDASSNVVSLIGFRLAAKPADEEHPFGHGRYEYLAGLTVAVIICALGLTLVVESVDKIAHPQAAQINVVTVAVLLASMAVKLGMMALNATLGRAISSQTLAATAADSRNDVVTTGVVLACAVIQQATGVVLDGWAGVGVGLFICVSGLGLVRGTFDELLGSAPDEAFVADAQKMILSYPGILGAHDLMVHDYGPGHRFASAHVQMDGRADAFANHKVIDTIERDFKEKTGVALTLHYDPVDTVGQNTEAWLSRQVAQIDPALKVHDLRLGGGFITFDLVKPDECEISDEDVLQGAIGVVAQRWPGLPCSITLDHGFLARG